MIETAVTLVPFERIDEILTYFSKNVENLGVRNAIAYIEATKDWQRSATASMIPSFVEPRFVSTGMNLTLFEILESLKRNPTNLILIDSDNLLDPNFQQLDDSMVRNGFDFYSVKERNSNASVEIKRSTLAATLGEYIIRNYKIRGRWRSPVFFGPKQAIRIGRDTLAKLDADVMGEIKQTFLQLDPAFEHFLADETLLGTIFLYSGLALTPWIIASEHKRIGTTREPSQFRSFITAAASVSFARLVDKRKYGKFRSYLVRYALALAARALLL
jgi:hypothetical protein